MQSNLQTPLSRALETLHNLAGPGGQIITPIPLQQSYLDENNLLILILLPLKGTGTPVPKQGDHDSPV